MRLLASLLCLTLAVPALGATGVDPADPGNNSLGQGAYQRGVYMENVIQVDNNGVPYQGMLLYKGDNGEQWVLTSSSAIPTNISDLSYAVPDRASFALKTGSNAQAKHTSGGLGVFQIDDDDMNELQTEGVLGHFFGSPENLWTTAEKEEDITWFTGGQSGYNQDWLDSDTNRVYGVDGEDYPGAYETDGYVRWYESEYVYTDTTPSPDKDYGSFRWVTGQSYDGELVGKPNIHERTDNDLGNGSPDYDLSQTQYDDRHLWSCSDEYPDEHDCAGSDSLDAVGGIGADDEGATGFMQEDPIFGTNPVLIGLWGSYVKYTPTDSSKQSGSSVEVYKLFERANLNWLLGKVYGGPLQGDANEDLQVTGADIIDVQAHFGSQGIADCFLPGDSNCDGSVTGADIIKSQQTSGNCLLDACNYPAVSEPHGPAAADGSVFAVPEASTLALLVTGVLMLIRRR